MLVLAASAAAQEPPPARPGPYVIDVRGSISGVPAGSAFYPPLPPGAVIPARGFGAEVGAHVYPIRLGVSTLGIGAGFMRLRGSVGDPDVSATITALTPQLSFNFGTRTGWSYLSAGYGNLQIDTSAGESGELATGRLDSVNVGGGARWFLSSHVATGFDVRFHRVGGNSNLETPATTVVSASIGLSFR